MVAANPTKRVAGYYVEKAAKYARLSDVMVDYLCRTNVLVPTSRGARGRGHKRIYSFGDVVMLRAIAKLLDAGVSVSRLKASLIGLRRHHPEITPTSLPARLIVSDGKSVFLRDNHEVVEDLASGQFAFAFVLELRAIQQEVRAKVKTDAKFKSAA